MRPLVVGYSPNPRATQVTEALDPRVQGSAGAKLMDMAGMDLETFVSEFDRVNVSGRLETRRDMVRRVAELEASGAMSKRGVLIVGRATANLFRWPRGLPRPLMWVWWPHLESHVAWAPHTSGLCRYWNCPSRRRELREFFDEWRKEKA